MARPQTDIEAGQKLILNIVEGLIRKRGAVEVTLQEVATEADMSQSNIYRFFDSKEALWEAVAESWFRDKVEIMEEVTASDLPVEQKLYDFFARRFVLMRDKYRSEPELFKSYCELGEEHFEVVKSYLDLGDHYLAMIISEAMDEGYFQGLTIDETVSLINMMVQSYVSADTLMRVTDKLTVNKLQIIIGVIFSGLHNEASQILKKKHSDLHLVS